MARENTAQETFALAIAVGKRGVEERAAEIDERSSAAMDSASSEPDQPPMPHSPYPTSETGQPSRPNARVCIGRSDARDRPARAHCYHATDAEGA